jgi:hypothetical protein
MDVSTVNQVIPGMEDMGAFGGMMGMPRSGPVKNLFLRLISPQSLPSSPEASHDIPPGQRMGDSLPLIIPPKAQAERYEGQEEQPRYEKPKMRMLIYWGCGEEVPKGQPLVIDTERMNMADFGKAMAGRSGSQHPPMPRSGRIYSQWPNERSSKQVLPESSLKGGQLVHGNYTPDIRFSIDEGHDFMSPVSFSSVRGGLRDSIGFQWKAIPTATGYFASAMSSNRETEELILWSSSEVKETGWGLMDFLSPGDVRRLIQDRVVMPSDRTSCSVPKGIFRDTEGAMLQFIAYGDELNVVHPPRPKDPKEQENWRPIWEVKERRKSTAMLPLGMEGMDGSDRRGRRGRAIQQPETPQEPERPQEAEAPDTPDNGGGEENGMTRGLKRFFGF